MSKDYSFNVMPSVSISRSRFARKSQHKTSFNLGDIIPIYVDEVLPGDTMSFDMADLVRMSQPIAPIMDNIYLDFYAFFVPNRLVWDHWKAFMGENEASAGIPSTTYSVPRLFNITTWNDTLSTEKLWDYMGLPRGTLRKVDVNALPFRGYYLIYNEWFRDQNLIAPIAVQKGDTNEAIVGQASLVNYPVLKAAKLSDYFTRSLPYAQKASPVSIPLGNYAPLAVQGTSYTVGNIQGNNYHKIMLSGASVGGALGTNVSEELVGQSGSTSTAGNITNTNLVADLSTATAATINQLRYAFQLQKLLEKDALYGTRYWEILASHFGIKAPDASLQRPEYLGGYRQRINIDQVLSTSGYNDDATQDVGKPGANSVSGMKTSLFTKSFCEHGHVFVLAVARHDQTYTQGINRMWSRTNRYDYYFPVFANLGAQEVRLKEIYNSGNSGNDNIFGYQEAWAEYRMKPSICTGLMRPLGTGYLNYWTLANNFGAAPTLGQTFIEQDRNALQRALATGSTGPDFIADFFFQNICVRPMPMYSIPGLIDHH